MTPISLTRRSFLGTSLTALGGLSLSPAALASAGRARPSEPRRLIVVELRGGLDGLAALQPLEHERLLRVRPTLGKRKPDLEVLADDCGLHPRLARLAQRFRAGGLGIWRGVGHGDPSLSHFESRDYWDEGRVAELRTGIGWLGRFGETLGTDPLSMLAIGDGSLPGSMRGLSRMPPAVRGLSGLSIRGPDSKDGARGPRRAQAIERLFAATRGDEEREFVARQALETADAARRLAAAEERRPKSGFPRSPLATDLAAVAAVLDAGIDTRVFHVVHDGYDTHADQATRLDRLLGELDAGLEALLAHLEAQGRSNEVLLLTTTEFGRRVAESGEGGSTGTDHGTASVLFTAGGGARPGLFGPAPDLERLDPAGNYAAGVDFRRIYAGVLAGWLGADAAAMIGPEFAPEEVARA